MAIKDILVHLSSDPRSGARLETAISLARVHEARLTALYVLPTSYIPAYAIQSVPLETLADYRRVAEEAAGESRAAFMEATERSGVASDWRSTDGARDSEILRHACSCDVVVVGQPKPDDGPGAGLTEPLVFGSGRPVITVPYAGDFATLGERVLVAWDATREASRALHDALPILVRAKEVIVYSVNPAESGQISAADIAAHLARHGVAAEVHQTVSRIPENETAVIGRRSLGVGDLLLSAASDFSADLLIMGAYGHSRIRELVLGGATRYVLHHMTVPVFMSH